MTPTLLDDYRLPPGVCYLCKAARRHPGEVIVDTGLMVDTSSGITGNPASPNFSVAYVEEPLVICGPCVTELGRAAGLIPADEATALRVVATLAEAAVDQLRAERDDLRTALAALHRAGGWQGRPVIGEVPEQILEDHLAGLDPSEYSTGIPAADLDPLACCGRSFATPSALNLHRARSAAHKETR